MASLIPGYNYDIFLSYCQKDNKYDGWVFGFADNLNNESNYNVTKREVYSQTEL
jgi:hypothetical protein